MDSAEWKECLLEAGDDEEPAFEFQGYLNEDEEEVLQEKSHGSIAGRVITGDSDDALAAVEYAIFSNFVTLCMCLALLHRQLRQKKTEFRHLVLPFPTYASSFVLLSPAHYLLS